MISRLTPLFLLALLAVPGQGQPPKKLPDFDRRTPAVLAVQNVGPAVVNIKTKSYVRTSHLFGDIFMRPRNGNRLQDRTLGSGVIVHETGYLVTNEHVVHGAASIQVTLRDGRKFDAKLVNSSVDSDLAVLKLGGKGPFPSVAFGDSDDLLVGETVFALGNPFGLTNSLTFGVLSATEREVHFRNRTVFKDFLQTSALINPGNSGGPLLDINGRVIGVNVAIDTRGQGIGYAIPINRVKRVMTALIGQEVVRNAWVGFEVEPAGEALVVTRVYADGPARESGVRRGDVIRTVAGDPVTSPFDFYVTLLRSQMEEKEQKVRLTVERDRRRTEVVVSFQAMTHKRNDAGMTFADLTPRLNRRFGLPADLRFVVVTRVEPGGAASQVGIEQGDIILEIGGYTVRNAQTLNELLGYLQQRGTPISIVVFRNQARHQQGHLPSDEPLARRTQLAAEAESQATQFRILFQRRMRPRHPGQEQGSVLPLCTARAIRHPGGIPVVVEPAHQVRNALVARDCVAGQESCQAPGAPGGGTGGAGLEGEGQGRSHDASLHKGVYEVDSLPATEAYEAQGPTGVLPAQDVAPPAPDLHSVGGLVGRTSRAGGQRT
jgi:serine protease Do